MTRITPWLSSFAVNVVLLGAAMVLIPSDAIAERKSSLQDAPAVRHRLLLVKKRFEVTLATETSINTEFRHTLGGGLKLEYHLSDVLSVGGLAIAGASFNTRLTDKIIATLPDETTRPMGDPTPTSTEFSSHLNKIPLHGALYIGLTPWYGKLAAFGKFFVNFDFYFQGGLALALLDADCDNNICSDTSPSGGIDAMGMMQPGDGLPYNDPVLNDGLRAGLYLGGGIHVFLNNFIALDLTVRDYLFEDNPSGLDYDADLMVSEADNRFLNHLFMGVGVSFLLPTTVKRTQ